MSAGAEKSIKGKAMPKGRNARSGNIYDRIAEARNRRETSQPIDKKETKPPTVTKTPTTVAPLPTPDTLDRLTKPAKPANQPVQPKTSPLLAPVEDDSPQEETPKRGGFWLWGVSALITLALIGYVSFGYVPPTGVTEQVAAPEKSDTDLTRPTLQTDVPTAPRADAPAPETQPAPRLATLPSPDAAPLTRPDGSVASVLAFDPADYRVVLHTPRSVSSNSLRVIVAEIERAGITAEPRRINLAISKSNVRYYHAADAEMAALLAEAANATPRDFTAFRPRPAEGLIEIWLAGRARAPSNSGTTTLADEFKTLRNRIARALGQR